MAEPAASGISTSNGTTTLSATNMDAIRAITEEIRHFADQLPTLDDDDEETPITFSARLEAFLERMKQMGEEAFPDLKNKKPKKAEEENDVHVSIIE